MFDAPGGYIPVIPIVSWLYPIYLILTPYISGAVPHMAHTRTLRPANALEIDGFNHGYDDYNKLYPDISR